MYCVVFDTFTTKPKYQKQVARIEGRFVDLGLKTQMVKLNLLRSLKESVNDAIKKGAHTIVGVGDDKIFNQIVNIVADNKIVVGFIPVRNSLIAENLGMPQGEEACSVISARRTAKLDIAKVNNLYFLSQIEIQDPEARVRCNDKFTVSSLVPKNSIVIYNLGQSRASGNWQANPQDGLLEAIIEPAKSTGVMKLFRADKNFFSRFFTKKIRVTSEKNTTALVDGRTVIKTPLVATSTSRQLSLIVGKQRTFA